MINTHPYTRTCGDGSETFLACSIPDLQFDFLAVDQQCLDLEIDSVFVGWICEYIRVGR